VKKSIERIFNKVFFFSLLKNITFLLYRLYKKNIERIPNKKSMVIREKKLESKNSSKIEYKQTRFSDNYEYIVDSSGQKVEYNDSRLVYIEPSAIDPYGKRLIENFYKTRGKNIRFVDDTTSETIQYAKKICSGRECLPTMAIVGGLLKDIYESRGKDEISIYRLALEQDGPCQNGGWPFMWEIFAKRLKIENVIFCGTLGRSKKYMGLSFWIYAAQVVLQMLGHYITEAKNALHIVARNPVEALVSFEKITDNFIGKVKDIKKSLKIGLEEWAIEISKIPLKAKVEEMPKVLIFGGLNLLFTHYPFEEYFLNNGIIPKVVDLYEPSNWVLYEYIMRYNFELGRITSKKQFSLSRLIFSLIFKKYKLDGLKALTTRLAMNYVDSHVKTYRKIIGKTKLLFEEDISFKTLIEESRKSVSCFVFNETLTTTGRFIQSIKSDYYDGLINLGSFNCQPAMNSQAVIRPLANQSDMPYIAIDCEGPWISSSHQRLLETIAVQAKRVRKEKNKKTKILS
jgi:predicted nucleotide-binding protein (sugar kinase/HSP70/actin superfamily)